MKTNTMPNTTSKKNKHSKNYLITLILRNLIEQTSLEEVTESVLRISKSKEEEIVLKDEIPLSTLELLSIIYKSCGPIKLLNSFLAIMNESDSKKSKKKNINKEKFIHADYSLKSKKKEKIEKFVNSINDNEIKINNGNDNIDYNDSDGIIVEIQNEIENKKENIIKEDIIELNESQSSTKEINLNSGLKTEAKLTKKKRKILKSPRFYVKHGLKSESKIFKPLNKLKKEEPKFSYHYSIIEGNLYKYQFQNINDEKNKAKFVCDDPKCNAQAEYDIINKIFTLNNGHNLKHSDHDYIKNIKLQVVKIFEYMQKENRSELQLTKS